MKKYRNFIILFLLILFIIGLFLAGPIPQDLAYHDFADKRSYFGIPNFWDVVSNLPLFFLGVYGSYLSLKNWSARPDFVARFIPLFLSFGIFTACFGSAYYHWIPNNVTLVWDRLPMTLMFMPLFALLIYDFIGKKEGEIAFCILIPLGIFSSNSRFRIQAKKTAFMRDKILIDSMNSDSYKIRAYLKFH